MRPSRVRSSFARAKARVYLRENGLKGPPVDIVWLIAKHGRLKWDREAGEGVTLYDEKRDYYWVVINPDAAEGRITWTLCHELAHIVLGHFTDYDLAGLTPRESQILERECDIFVRELLMPESWVFRFYRPPLTVQEIGRLKDKFDVSWEALSHRLAELGICKKTELNKMFRAWRSQQASVVVYERMAQFLQMVVEHRF